MGAKPKTKPIEDTVSRVNDEVAVGEDLEFQRKWWRFETAIWIVLTIIVILDLLGAFGRGYLAKAEANAIDGSVHVKYERIERFKTPSIMRVELGPGAVHDGKVRLWTSESLVTDLGNQRVIPQPQASVVGNGGTLYTFEATQNPMMVEFALEPGNMGVYDLSLGVEGLERLKLKIYVMP